jgi:hypothetical protein
LILWPKVFGSISPTFLAQLLSLQTPKVQKDSLVTSAFFCLLGQRVKRW